MKLRSILYLARSVVLIVVIAVIAVLAAEHEAWASSSSGSSDRAKRRSTVPKREADLSITKSAHPDGNTFVFLLTVNNVGPVAAERVEVTDALSRQFALVSVNGPNCNSKQSITCKLGTLGVGASVTITIRVRVRDGFKGSIINIAQVGAKTKDPNPSNNKASALVTVIGRPETDLSISKKARQVRGGDFIFTITVKNNGRVAAENVEVSDQLSRRFGLVNVQGPNCLGDQTITCKLGTLGAGRSATIEIRVSVASTSYRGLIRNTATVGSITNDTNSRNNSSSVSVRVNGRR